MKEFSGKIRLKKVTLRDWLSSFKTVWFGLGVWGYGGENQKFNHPS